MIDTCETLSIIPNNKKMLTVFIIVTVIIIVTIIDIININRISPQSSFYIKIDVFISVS